jgi:hypothetical protein
MDQRANLEEAREECGSWDEELETCLDGFPEECPFHEECKKESEED